MNIKLKSVNKFYFLNKILSGQFLNSTTQKLQCDGLPVMKIVSHGSKIPPLPSINVDCLLSLVMNLMYIIIHLIK